MDARHHSGHREHGNGGENPLLQAWGRSLFSKSHSTGCISTRWMVELRAPVRPFLPPSSQQVQMVARCGTHHSACPAPSPGLAAQRQGQVGADMQGLAARRWGPGSQTQGENLHVLQLGLRTALGKGLATAWKKPKDLLDITRAERCSPELPVKDSGTHMHHTSLTGHEEERC